MIIRKIYGLARNILHNSVSGWWAFNCPLGFLIWMLFQLKRTIGRIKRKTEKRVDSFVSLQRILKLKVAEWISKKLS